MSKSAMEIIWVFYVIVWAVCERENLLKIYRRVRCLLLGHLITTTNTVLDHGVSTTCTVCRRGCGHCETSVRNFENLRHLYPYGSRVEFDCDGYPIITGFPPATPKCSDVIAADGARNT